MQEDRRFQLCFHSEVDVDVWHAWFHEIEDSLFGMVQPRAVAEPRIFIPHLSSPVPLSIRVGWQACPSPACSPWTPLCSYASLDNIRPSLGVAPVEQHPVPACSAFDCRLKGQQPPLLCHLPFPHHPCHPHQWHRPCPLPPLHCPIHPRRLSFLPTLRPLGPTPLGSVGPL